MADESKFELSSSSLPSENSDNSTSTVLNTFNVEKLENSKVSTEVADMTNEMVDCSTIPNSKLSPEILPSEASSDADTAKTIIVKENAKYFDNSSSNDNAFNEIPRNTATELAENTNIKMSTSILPNKASEKVVNVEGKICIELKDSTANSLVSFDEIDELSHKPLIEIDHIAIKKNTNPLLESIETKGNILNTSITRSKSLTNNVLVDAKIIETNLNTESNLKSSSETSNTTAELGNSFKSNSNHTALNSFSATESSQPKIVVTSDSSEESHSSDSSEKSHSRMEKECLENFLTKEKRDAAEPRNDDLEGSNESKNFEIVLSTPNSPNVCGTKNEKFEEIPQIAEEFNKNVEIDTSEVKLKTISENDVDLGKKDIEDSKSKVKEITDTKAKEMKGTESEDEIIDELMKTENKNEKESLQSDFSIESSEIKCEVVERVVTKKEGIKGTGWDDKVVEEWKNIEKTGQTEGKKGSEHEKKKLLNKRSQKCSENDLLDSIIGDIVANDDGRQKNQIGGESSVKMKTKPPRRIKKFKPNLKTISSGLILLPNTSTFPVISDSNSTMKRSHCDKIYSSYSKSPKLPNLRPEKRKDATEDLIGARKILTSYQKQTVKSDEGHDSGVDEKTQSKKNGSRRSVTKGTRSGPPKRTHHSVDPSMMGPRRTPPSNTAAPERKLPMNKIEVGKVASPNIKTVQSKIGSLANAQHTPGGGRVRIESKKLDFKNTTSRVGAKNESYVSKGGEKKIESRKLVWNVESKIGSLENKKHVAGGGDKRIESQKINFKERAQSKIGSKDNIKHKAGGGDVQIQTEKLDFKDKSASKVGSFDNVKHKAAGGDKKIFDDKEYLRQKQTVSGTVSRASRNSSRRTSGTTSPQTGEIKSPVGVNTIDEAKSPQTGEIKSPVGVNAIDEAKTQNGTPEY